MLEKFLHDNSTGARLARTILEALLSTLSVKLAIIMGSLNLTPETAAIATAVAMCVITPVISVLRSTDLIEGDK